ncbi:hypothetical protein BCAR13_610038 [Paraburkholderia caribensis]|nr:hypothetical protein BCAR13_610038 [Paraburkholderia caribensis]
MRPLLAGGGRMRLLRFCRLPVAVMLVRGFLCGLFGRSVDVVLGIGPRLDVASVLLDLGGDVAVVGRHDAVAGSLRRGDACNGQQRNEHSGRNSVHGCFDSG